MNNFINFLSNPPDDLQKLNIRQKVCYWANKKSVVMATKQLHGAEKNLKMGNELSKQLKCTKLKIGKHKQSKQNNYYRNATLKTVQVQIMWPNHGMPRTITK